MNKILEVADSMATKHYKEQRDKLFCYLRDNVGLTDAKIARILGIHRQAINIQFPKKTKPQIPTDY